MAVPGPPTFKEAPPPLFVEHLFFKSFPVLTLPSPAPAEELLARSSHSLACSCKYGVLLVAGQERLTIIPAKELLLAQTTASNSHQKRVELGQVPYATVSHPSFGSSPTIVAISVGEEYLALDTVRNGVSFVLIFKLGEFLIPGSGCQPYAELREGGKVCGIAWNPGENMSNILAINCDDGSLQLASLKGFNAVEMCSYKEGGVRSMCWSPKGKQLVVGKLDGSLCQLKLDLNEAKRISSPGTGQTPTALFWTSTTQFLVNYVVEDKDMDLMQLDLVKGSPLSFTKFGDVYVSDRVDSQAKCTFLPILPWNVIICASNTINDLVVIGKGLHESSENWIVTDLNDNRRGAIPIDSFAIGAALFSGFESPVTFNETETYSSMPVVFVLSDSGALASFVLVNSKLDAPSVFQKVSNALPPQLFFSSSGENPTKDGSSQNATLAAPPHIPGSGDAQPAQTQPFQMPQLPTAPGVAPTLQFGNLGFPSFGASNTSLFGSTSQQQPITTLPKPETGPSFSMPAAVAGTSNFSFGTSLNFTPTSTTSNVTLTQTQLTTPAIVQPVVSAKSASVIQPPGMTTKQPPLFDIKSLPTTGLPNLQQVEDLKRIVEEKRAQGGFSEADDPDEPDMDELLLEVEKFQKRLELYNQRRAETSLKAVQTFNELRKEHEVDVLAPLNLMEDFVTTLKETKEIQSEEVNGIKERVISHYTELEYAKALEERNKDPKYIQLLMAQPMDAGRTKKFCETEKLYQYIKNQNVECERFYKFQNQQPDSNQNSSALQGIYQTLANHSRVIRKLSHNVNALRSQMGLPKIPGMEDKTVFEIPTMGHNYYEKKPLLKERPTITIQKGNVHKIKAEKDDRITLDDLTAGMSRVKLNKIKEAQLVGRSGFPNHKPMRISTKKLEALTKIVSKVEDIEITVNDKNVYDPFDISIKNRARSRNLINKLDEKTSIPVKSDIKIPEEIIKEAPALPSSSTFSPPVIRAPTKILASFPTRNPTTLLASPPSSPPIIASTSAAIMAPTGPTTIFGLKSTSIIAPTTNLAASPTLAPIATTSSSLAPVTVTSSKSGSITNSVFVSPQVTTATSIQNLSKISFSSPLSAAPLTFGSSTPSSSLFGPRPVSPKPAAFGISSSPEVFGTTPAQSSASIFAPSPAFGSGVAPFAPPGTIPTKALTPPIRAPATPATTSPVLSTSIDTGIPSSGFMTSATVAPAIGLNLVNNPDDQTVPLIMKSDNNVSEDVKTGITPTALFSSLASNLTISSSAPPVITPIPPTILPVPQVTSKVTTTPAPVPVTTSAPSISSIAVTVSPTTTSSAPLSLGSLSIAPSLPLFGSTSPKPAFESAAVFGTTPTLTPSSATSSAFGSGGSTFGSAFGASIPATGNIFASTTTSTSTFGASPAVSSSTPAFGTPTTSSIFGAAAASPFGGSVFGSTTTPATSGNEGSIFAPTTSSSIFGAATPRPAFGSPSSSSVFGAAPAFGGSPVAASTTFGGSPAFGSGVAASTFGSAFGSGGGAGDGSIFGSPTTTSIFGAASKPAAGFGSAPVFGSSPAFGSAATFGGSPAFGSGGSTFCSAFGASPGASGTGTGSIFGGGSIQQSSPSFGALAQAAPPAQQGFGSFTAPTMGGSIFGGAAQPSSPFGGGGQQSSIFGGGTQASSPFGQQQQQSSFGGSATTTSASFGGSAFSSWR